MVSLPITNIFLGEVSQLSPAAKHVVAASMERTFTSRPCGICERAGGGVSWASPDSNSVHNDCFEAVKGVETDLMVVINTLFTQVVHRSDAHSAAIGAVKRELGGLSIIRFLELNGAVQLKAIVDSVGIAAVRSYSNEN